MGRWPADRAYAPADHPDSEGPAERQPLAAPPESLEVDVVLVPEGAGSVDAGAGVLPLVEG
jgi:hypothetical protein